MAWNSHAFDDQMVLPFMANLAGRQGTDTDRVRFDAPEIDLSIYDHFIVCLSGGKDSIACLLHLLDLGVDNSRIELWHHDVDGREGSTLVDWIFMRDYNQKLADAFGLPLFFSWLKHGFEGEMTKENTYSHPHMVETPEGLLELPRDTSRAKPGTRLRFPQQAASLQTRWCSSALKIDVGRRALNNQSRFEGKKVLFITGERRDESSNRARYNQFEPHFCDRRAGRLKRHVDAFRPVLHWDEARVWEIIAKHRLIAPVPYRLGWGRSSCQNCIFGSAKIWATLNAYFPERTQAIAGYEDRFGSTISRDRINVIELGSRSAPMEITDLEALEQATRHEYTLPLFVDRVSDWVMPAGAFGTEGCGAA